MSLLSSLALVAVLAAIIVAVAVVVAALMVCQSLAEIRTRLEYITDSLAADPPLRLSLRADSKLFDEAAARVREQIQP